MKTHHARDRRLPLLAAVFAGIDGAFEFIDAIPRTSTGKFWKVRLRERFANWVWPDAS